MSLNEVVKEILRRGEMKERETIRQGEKERDEPILRAKKEIEENREKAERQFRAAVSQMEQQEVSSAELESKRLLLAAQRRVMEELKQQVLSELARYPSDKRKVIYAKLVAKAAKELGRCVVYSNAEDKKLLTLAKGMEDGGIIESSGGLVFETKDGSVRLDFRFESLLEEVWAREVQEIYGKLFR